MVKLSEFDGWDLAWEVPDRRPIYEWFNGTRLPETYAKPGPFDISYSPYMIEPFIAFKDPEVRQIEIVKAVQTGGTLLSEGCILWALVNQPGPIMWTWQKQDMAEDHAKTRFAALMRSVPKLKKLLEGMDRTERTTTKFWFGSFFLLINYQTLKELQSKSIRYMITDEGWLWKPGHLDLAARRVSAFAERGLSKIMNVSQAGYTKSEQHKLWEQSTKRVWGYINSKKMHVPLDWSLEGPEGSRAGVVWADDYKREDGSYSVARACETVRWRDPITGEEMADGPKLRRFWKDNGGYAATNPDGVRAHEGYFWNGLIQMPLKTLVQEYVNAQNAKRMGDLGPMELFYQQRLSKFWDQEGGNRTVNVALSGRTLAEAWKSGKEEIDGEVARIMTIDVQQSHYHAVIRAFRSDMSSELLYVGFQVPTAQTLREVQQHFGVEDYRTLVDCKYDKAKSIGMCHTYGWLGVQGTKEYSFRHSIGSKRGKAQYVRRYYSAYESHATNDGKFAPVVSLATDPLKDILFRYASGRAAPWGVPEDAPKEYREAIESGEMKKEVSPGTYRWIKTKYNNHHWDCEYMQIAGCIMLGLLKFDVSDDKGENKEFDRE